MLSLKSAPGRRSCASVLARAGQAANRWSSRQLRQTSGAFGRPLAVHGGVLTRHGGLLRSGTFVTACPAGVARRAGAQGGLTDKLVGRPGAQVVRPKRLGQPEGGIRTRTPTRPSGSGW